MYSRPDEVSILSDIDNELFNTLDLPPIVLESYDKNELNNNLFLNKPKSKSHIFVFVDECSRLTPAQVAQINWIKHRNGKGIMGTLDGREVISLSAYHNRYRKLEIYVFSDDGSALTLEERTQVEWTKKNHKNLYTEGNLGDRKVILLNKTPRLPVNQYVFADNFDTLLTQAEIGRVVWLDSTQKMGKLDDREVIIRRKGSHDYRIVFASNGHFITPAEYARVVWNTPKRTSGKLDERDVITRLHYNNIKNTIVDLDTGKPIPKDQKLKVQWDDKERKRGQLDGRIVIPKDIYLREHPKHNDCTAHSETHTSAEQSFDLDFSQSIESSQFNTDNGAYNNFFDPNTLVTPDFSVVSDYMLFQDKGEEKGTEAGISTQVSDSPQVEAGVMPQVSAAQTVAPSFGFFASQQNYLQKRRLSAISTDEEIVHQHLSDDEQSQRSPAISSKKTSK